ncbi:MAG: hypothetical protein IJB44_07300 [Clostridia bacterium]|nr:hypothetical protein [Clostridia bacterium]
MTRFIQTSFGNASPRSKPKSNAQSATFGPTPFICISAFLASSVSSKTIFSKSICPETIFSAASAMYLSLNPAFIGPRDSRVIFLRLSFVGKV